MKLPKQTYENLPALYVVLGFIAGQVVDSNLALASGALLTAVGINVFHLRLRYRDTYEEIELKGIGK